MLCQKCMSNEATTHLTKIINGQMTQTHLCASCCQKGNYDGVFESFSLEIPNILANFFGDSSATLRISNEQRCENCGCSFDDIIKTGRVGCANCYDKFYEKLLPSIQRIHGRSTHVGKVPQINEIIKVENTKSQEIDELTSQMKQASEKMDFEQALILRDKIDKLKEANKE